MSKQMDILSLAELFVSAVTHLLCGFYICCSAIAFDLSQAIITLFSSDFSSVESLTDEKEKEVVLDGSVPPIVLVHGLFGFGKGKLGGLSYFGGAEKKDGYVLVPDLGSLTSIHDRARELFYYLKGGKVDYGEERSKIYKHSQFGRDYEKGHYPIWDEHHPVHFVGHSAGAQVVRVLQQMLADKAFTGYENTTEDWVLSITSLSGALNGTTRAYLDGMEPEDGATLKSICLLQICRVGAIFYEWMDIAWLKNYYSFGFDHFEMSWRKVGIWGLADLLVGNTGPFATGNWVLPDLTIQGSIRINSGLRTFPNTYYFSYASNVTRKVKGVTMPTSIFKIHPLLLVRVVQMCQWRFSSDSDLPFKGYSDEEWEENDGALNLISMTHPRFPVEHPSHLVSDESECLTMKPGIWYYRIVEVDHIYYIVNRDRAGHEFDVMYDTIFQRCRKHVFRSTATLPSRAICW